MSGLLSYDDIFPTEGCQEKHLALIIREKIRLAQANEEKSPGRLHTIPYNKIVRNCMELSGILTVQALCVFSCLVHPRAGQSGRKGLHPRQDP